MGVFNEGLLELRDTNAESKPNCLRFILWIKYSFRSGTTDYDRSVFVYFRKLGMCFVDCYKSASKM